MKQFRFAFLFFVIITLTVTRADTKPAMGINFSGLSDWNTELPFMNVFLQSRRWVSHRAGEGWGKGPELTLDKHGWIKRLETNCFADTPLCTIEGGHYPSGIYTCYYRGRGRIEFKNAKIIQQTEGRILIKVDSTKGPFWLRIRETNPDDYIRDIELWVPGHDKSLRLTKTGIWNPTFLDRWKGVSVVRFMDMQATNGSTLEKWSGRPVVGDATYANHGAPIEVLCDLANRLNADPWFCVPHRASDDFVRQMARTIKANLKPERRIYIEYSNEVWNRQFEQNRYASKRGQELKLAQNEWEAAWCYYAFRSKEIFKVFEKEFGGTTRLVRVLATQAANPYVSEMILKFRDVYKSADVLAIAPYMSLIIEKEKVKEYINLGLEGILQQAEESSLPQAMDWMERQKVVADRYALKLACYESGQHLVGLPGANNSEELNQLLYAANSSLRMGKLYEAYFSAWEKLGGGVICHYSSCGRWSKHGSWGLIQYADDSADDYPKYRTTIHYMKKWNK